MGRGVRPTGPEAIRQLSDEQLDAYIVETIRRMASLTKAALRSEYGKQLYAAEQIRAGRETSA